MYTGVMSAAGLTCQHIGANPIQIYQSDSHSHWHEQNPHASFTCPCMHGIRPIGIALDT